MKKNCFNIRTAGLTVASLNVLVCAGIPVYYFITIQSILNGLRHEYGDEAEELFHVDQVVCNICYGILALTVPGILLLIGIIKKYRILVGLWVYLVLTLVILMPPALLYAYQAFAAFGADFRSLNIATALWVYLCVCLIPIGLLYKKMLKNNSTPAPPPPAATEPTDLKSAEDEKKYMPIFEGF